MSSRYEFDTDRYAGSGIIIKGITGEVVGNRKLVYMGPLGTWLLADADLAATLPGLGLTLNGAALGGRIEILLKGYVGLTTWAWVVGGEIYASSTAGELTQVAAGLVQIVGMAGPSTDFMYFNGDFSTGAGGVVCALLEGHTAYVGFDLCKGTNYTNYFYCDGTADDVQINAAVVYVNGLGGGSVFMEQGDYDITSSVVMLTNVWLTGAGHDTVLIANVALADHVIKEENALYFTDWMLSDFMIDGSAQTVGSAIRGWRGFRVKIRNIKIDTADENGIDISTIQDLHISDCHITDVIENAIEVYGNVDHRAIIVNNHVITPGINGIQLYWSAGPGDSHSEIVGNTIIGSNSADTDQRGINIQRANHVTVTGNTVNFMRMGAYLTGVADSTINGNTFTDNGWDGVSAGAGIWMEGGCERVNISDNICSDNTPTATGINISDGGATDLIIDGNICAGNGGAGIRVITAHITITNNICKNNNQSGLGATNNSGINLADDAINCIVTGNWCYDDQGVGATQDVGIRETNNADFNHIYHNRLSGNVTQQAVIIGPDTQVPELFAPISDPNTTVGDHPGVDMPDNTDTNVYAQVLFPLEFQELVASSVIVVSVASGDMVWTVNTDFGKLCVSEDYNTHTDSGGATDTLVINDLECIDISAALTAIAAGDLVGVNFMRDGDAGGDTIGDSVYYMGLRVRYV